MGYECDVFNRMCVPQPGGQGTYTTLGDCQADCGPKCWVPEETGPYITNDGFWHPGHPLHGAPCQRDLVPYEEIREKGPFHRPCMTRAQCETAFHPVTVASTGEASLGSSEGCGEGSYPTKAQCNKATGNCFYNGCQKVGSCWQCVGLKSSSLGSSGACGTCNPAMGKGCTNDDCMCFDDGNCKSFEETQTHLALGKSVKCPSNGTVCPITPGGLHCCNCLSGSGYFPSKQVAQACCGSQQGDVMGPPWQCAMLRK